MSTTSSERVLAPTAAGARVEVDALTWRPFGRREPVLADLSLRIGAGERVLLAGPSGSGKSTLLRALAGVLTTTESGDLSGSVRVDGAEPSACPVGLLVQDPADAFVAGRVGRDVAFGPENLGMPRPAIWSRVAAALDAVRFPYGVDHPTRALSGGQGQRLALAGVLALGPRLVLLDEPTSMLDPRSAAVVRRAVVDAVVADGATLVLVEHQVEPWLAVVDRVVVLDGSGAVCADGPVRETLRAEASALLERGVWVPGARSPEPLDVDPALCAPARPAPAPGRASRAGVCPDRDTVLPAVTAPPGGDAVGPDRDTVLPADPASPVGDRSVAAVTGGPLRPARRTCGGPGADDVLVEARAATVTRAPRAGLGNRPGVAVPTLALAEVDLAVRAGEVVAVTGPSGAGKTTLTGLLAGLEPPTSGEVRAGPALLRADPATPSKDAASPRRATSSSDPVTPHPVTRHSVQARSATPSPDPAQWASVDLAAGVGWVPQQAELAVVGRTVRDDVLSTSRRLGVDEEAAAERADGLLAALGLGHLADADPHHLSGGEMRRLALAGALAHGPSLLVLDEPTVGQDRTTWAAVAGVVRAARDAGLGVVVATHDHHLVALADREVRLTPAASPDPGDGGEFPAPGGRAGGESPPLGDLPDTASREPTDDAGSFAAAAARCAPRAGPRSSGIAGRCGPLSLLLASAVLLVGAPFIRDLTSALVALGAELLLAPLVLGRVRTPWRSLAPGLLAVLSVGFSNWLLSADRDWASGAVAGLRVAFFVLPGVALAARIDPFALGDHLAQRLRLPGRPVVAAVAALQRFEALGHTWDQLGRTRRVRGLAPGRSPVARARHLGALTFALLVQTLRQAGRMAVAMEARGFSRAGTRRTWAEAAPWTRADTVLTALGLAVTGIPVLMVLLG